MEPSLQDGFCSVYPLRDKRLYQACFLSAISIFGYET